MRLFNSKNTDKPVLTLRFVFLNVAPILVTIIVFFTFNVLTPFWWDDFVMSCFITAWDEPHTSLLSSFSDVVISTRNMYQTWHGRSVADFINFLFMFFRDKDIFNICNTVIYCIFVLLTGFHVTGLFRKTSGPFFMFISILLWLELPAWGQNLLWLTGSCNYLWTGTMILLFLVPFRKRVENLSYKPHIVVSFLWIIPGILAGWSVENSASGVFILLLVYFILKKYRKERILSFEVFGSIGFMFGFFIFMRARQSLFPGFWGLAMNAVKVGISFICIDALILGSIILLAIELIHFRKTHIAKTALGFFVAALASAAAMIIPGFFGGRSAFITQVFLIITLLSLVIQIKQFISKKYFAAAGIVLILAFIPSFYMGSIEVIKGFLIAQSRERYIQSEKQKGNLAIKVKTPIPVFDSHSGLYDAIDILADPADPQYVIHNSAKAAWYGIESLDGIPTLRKPDINLSFQKFLKYRKSEGLSVNDLFAIIYEDW